MAAKRAVCHAMLLHMQLPTPWLPAASTVVNVTKKHVQSHSEMYYMLLFVRHAIYGWLLLTKPELAATLGSCMQDMMHGLKTGLEGQPNVTPAS
jgi:hypothetical protein